MGDGMIGLFAAHAGPFALGFAGVSTLAFALPFIFAPEGWGRAMRWAVPGETDLLRYYARCLGLLALAGNGLAVWAALFRPALLPAYFVLVTPFCASMVPLHVWGWLRREQPWTETAEIPMWTAAFVGCLAFFPAG